MAKRRLTDQQKRRIDENQKRQHESVGDVSSAGDSDSARPEKNGLVVALFGSQADIEDDSGTHHRCYLRANLGSIVTGDNVTWQEGDPKGVVLAIQPRHSQLCRPDNRGNLRPVAANIDRIVLVIAPKPEPHPNLIDRYLVAAENQGIKAMLVLNKLDLLTPENQSPLLEMLEFYRSLGYETLSASAHQHLHIDLLTTRLNSLTSVFVGQSGVGKSSLLNVLVPGMDAAVGDLSQDGEKGKHTTTTSKLFHLPTGGEVIDSPGIREFGLWHLEAERVAEGFVEFKPLLGTCKFRDCQHKQEPGCALSEALANGSISQQRYDSYWHILHSLENL